MDRAKGKCVRERGGFEPSGWPRYRPKTSEKQEWNRGHICPPLFERGGLFCFLGEKHAIHVLMILSIKMERKGYGSGTKSVRIGNRKETD